MFLLVTCPSHREFDPSCCACWEQRVLEVEDRLERTETANRWWRRQVQIANEKWSEIIKDHRQRWDEREKARALAYRLYHDYGARTVKSLREIAEENPWVLETPEDRSRTATSPDFVDLE
jgi:hypothetical protein